jgi:hypothetical protein
MKATFPKNPPREIEREVQTLQRDYADILKHAGKYVLIQGNSVVDFFQSYGEAITDGYRRFGLANFLVQPVQLQSTPIRAMRCGIVQTDGKLRLTKARRR